MITIKSISFGFDFEFTDKMVNEKFKQLLQLSFLIDDISISSLITNSSVNIFGKKHRLNIYLDLDKSEIRRIRYISSLDGEEPVNVIYPKEEVTNELLLGLLDKFV